MRKRVTMDDIAAELKVSKSLVSRALSDKYGVSEETRSLIKMTALRMGYKIATPEKSKNGKPESITLVVAQHDLQDAGFWVKVINAVERELQKHRISVFLSISQEENKSIPISIDQAKSSGVIILGQVPMEHIAAVNSTGLPVVFIDSKYAHLRNDHVMVNNFSASYEATRYVVQCGHRKVAFVGDPKYAYSFAERYRGYRDYVEGRPDVTTFDVIGKCESFYIPFDRSEFLKMINSKDRPTALICANDPTAFIVYDILASCNVKIPEDISVIGFDNVEKCLWLTPKLTTMNVPKEAMGKRAVELLLQRLQDPSRSYELVLLSGDLVIRDSVQILEDAKTDKVAK